MQSALKRMTSSIDRLGAAVDSMHQNTVTCRRNLMVFRARMGAVDGKVASMQDALTRTLGVLAEAETDARRAAAIFRATAEGRRAE